jgi:hypothetical protein
MANQKLLNRDIKGLSAILLGDEMSPVLELEAKAELDPRLQRINVFSATDLKTGLSLIKNYEIRLAIFPDNFCQNDFVFIQNEILNISPSTKVIPLLNEIDLTKIRESRRVGNLYDYAQSSLLSDYQSVASLIWNFCRDISKQTDTQPLFSAISKALAMASQTPTQSRAVGQSMIPIISSYFDVSSSEIEAISKANQLFLPWLAIENYADLLDGIDDGTTIKVLDETGSKDFDRKPKSIAGFIVTSAYYLAENIAKHGLERSLEIISERPIYLTHPAVRVLATAEFAAQLRETFEPKESAQLKGA